MYQLYPLVFQAEIPAKNAPFLLRLSGIYGIENYREIRFLQYGRQRLGFQLALAAGGVVEPEDGAAAFLRDCHSASAWLAQSDDRSLHADQRIAVEIGEELGVHLVEFAAHLYVSGSEPAVVDMDGNRLVTHYWGLFVVVEEFQGHMPSHRSVGRSPYHEIAFAHLVLRYAALNGGQILHHHAVERREAVFLLLRCLDARKTPRAREVEHACRYDGESSHGFSSPLWEGLRHPA